MKKCPFCAEDVQDEAIKCRHCASDLRAAPQPVGVRSQPRTEPERTVYKTGLHWAVFFRPALWLLLAVLFRMSSSLEVGVFGLFFVLVALVDLGGRFLMRANTHFTLTTQRLSMSTGVLRKRSLELVLPKVESITVNESLLGRALGYGTVIVKGTGGTQEPFPLVPRPQELRVHVQGQLAPQTR